MVAALAVVGSLLIATPASAAVAAPTGLSPNSSAAPVSANPVLSWNRVSGATSYDVEVSTTDAFTTTVYKVSTVNRQATPTAQLPATTIYWRVRARNSAGASAWSQTDFVRDGGGGPVLLAPSDGASLDQPNNPPLLKWQPVRGATSYSVEIDGAEHDWVGTTSYATKTSSFVVPDPQENGTYWWRVRALLGTGITTQPSEERSYTVGPLPVVGPSDLLQVDDVTSPAEGATLQDVVFDWDPVPGAISYDVRVATDNSFNDIIDTPVVFGTRYSPTKTYDVDDYWWQVRARNIFGKAQEWTDVRIRSFHRAWPNTPTLLYPSNAVSPSVGDDFYYQWTPVPLASRYRLDVGTDANFSPGTFDSCFVTQTTYTPFYLNSPADDDCAPAPGVTLYWRVKALDGPSTEIQGIYSAIRTFVYDPGSPVQTSPAQGATVDVPTLTWNPARDADKYFVVLHDNTGATVADETTYSTSWTITGKKQLSAAKSPYTWTVQAVDHNGAKSPLPIFATRSFSVSGNVPTTSAAALTPLSPAPNDSATVRFPRLTWEPIAGAEYYKVQVGTAGSGFFTPLSTTFPYPTGTDISVNNLSAGSYDWFVMAYNSSDALIGSGPTSTFKIGDLAAATNQRVALSGRGLDGIDAAARPCSASLPAVCRGLTETPVLDWDPVPGAGYYLIYLSRDPNFQNMVYGSLSTPTTLPSTSNTRWTPTEPLPESQAGVAYYWFIRPCKASGRCAADPTVASNAFDKKSNTVEAMTPVSASGSTVPQPYDAAAAPVHVANDVRFTWNDYLATNQRPAKADPLTGEQSNQAARSYHLQVGTTPAFSTIVDEATMDQTTYTAYNRTYPEGTLYWRIQAVDGKGNGLAWSDPMQFVKESPTVDLTSPNDAVQVSGTQPFRWQPLKFAKSYDLEVYKNDDTAASSTNRVLSASSKQVAYTTTTPLPAAATPYVWRVRRVDASNRPGAWSAWGRFRVGGVAPSLVSPTGGPFVQGNGALFTWQPSDAAASYKFERKAFGAASVSESVTTVSTSWAPSKLIADGTWQWRVTSIDANAKPIASSDWATFKVDGLRPTVTRKSPTGNVSRTTNFTVRFSEPVVGVSSSTVRIYQSGVSRPRSARVTLSADRRTATLNPSSNLTLRKYYKVTVSSSIKDVAGNSVVGTSWRVHVTR